MNPRQRRGALLIGASMAGALAVFLALTSYVGQVRAQVGPMAPTVRLVADLPPFTPVADAMIEVVDAPERWRPAIAVGSPSQVIGRVAATQLPAGTVLQQGMLRPPPSLERGLRELAILVDAETGVAGKIDVGSIVDIVATRRAEGEQPPRAEVVIEAVEILSIGTAAPAADQTLSGDFVSGNRVPVTFALPPDDILRLAWIESFAETVRLALRSPLDPTRLPPEQRVYQPFPDAGAGAAAATTHEGAE